MKCLQGYEETVHILEVKLVRQSKRELDAIMKMLKPEDPHGRMSRRSYSFS